MNIKSLLITTLFVAMVTLQSHASLILNLPADYTLGSSRNHSISEIANIIYHDTSPATLSLIGDLLYKSGPVEGEDFTLPLVASYSTTFTYIEGTGQANNIVGAKIVYDGGNKAIPTFLLIKSGNGEGSLVWDIRNWNGTEDIIIGDVFNKQISHVQIFGRIGVVPEPSTIIAGLCMLGIFAVSARPNKNRMV